MLEIIICDDNVPDQEKLEKYISRFFFEKEEVRFTCYTNGYELAQQMNERKDRQPDLLFMDITMPGMDGMTTAKCLRNSGNETNIVFVTNREDMVYQGYEVHAFAYLLKKDIEVQIEAVLKRYLAEQLKNSRKYLVVKKGKQMERIPLEFVKCLMSDKRKIRVMWDGARCPEEFYMKMTDAQKQLESAGFVRCHQSYLVNLNKIVRLERNTVIVTGGDRIPLSRRYRNEVIRRLKE